LFTELEKQNNLGIKRLEILKTLAAEMEKPNLIKQVEEFEKRREQEEDAERKENELEEARRRSQGEESSRFISNIKCILRVRLLERLRYFTQSHRMNAARQQRGLGLVRNQYLQLLRRYGD